MVLESMIGSCVKELKQMVGVLWIPHRATFVWYLQQDVRRAGVVFPSRSQWADLLTKHCNQNWKKKWHKHYLPAKCRCLQNVKATSSIKFNVASSVLRNESPKNCMRVISAGSASVSVQVTRSPTTINNSLLKHTVFLNLFSHSHPTGYTAAAVQGLWQTVELIFLNYIILSVFNCNCNYSSCI